ncbi:MAG: hypothetical protein CEN87_380 [Parcubacteria group bacterium Licking1014_1]|nr:MAG: hypothetical protein CEN87_380 [Parcubacteria group bacterium Licking1014_1]
MALNSDVSKKIVFFLLFIIIIGGFFGFWFYKEKIFSKEILKLEILGKDAAKTGDEIEYTVKYKNNGNFVLEQPRLIFELPENSLTEDGKMRITQNLKDIYPGDEEFIKFKARLLGKESDLKAAKASISYTPKNLTARYEVDTTFTVKIEATPITLDFDLPSKIEKGKEIQYSVNYFSNIDYPLENLSVKIETANGFDFEKSNPSSLDRLYWNLQTLNKAEGGRISINGKISAEAGSRLNFAAKLGLRFDGEFIVIKETQKEVEIIEPLLFISQQINGSSNYVANPGEKLHYEVFFRNIGSTSFDNLFMVAKLDGSAIDLSAIKVFGGQVQPNSNLIVWDWKQVSELRRLDVQQEGKVEFDLKLKDNWVLPDSEKNNVTIKNNVNISQITQEFATKVNSKLEIFQRVDCNNSSGQTVVCTINWEIKNHFNDVKNAKVRAILPQNFGLTGKILPESESSKFSFDNNSREIVWSIGDVPAGTGISNAPPSISFQVSLIPPDYQKGYLIPIAGEAVIAGEDQFTGAIITGKSPAILFNP